MKEHFHLCNASSSPTRYFTVIRVLKIFVCSSYLSRRKMHLLISDFHIRLSLGLPSAVKCLKASRLITNIDVEESPENTHVCYCNTPFLLCQTAQKLMRGKKWTSNLQLSLEMLVINMSNHVALREDFLLSLIKLREYERSGEGHMIEEELPQLGFQFWCVIYNLQNNSRLR